MTLSDLAALGSFLSGIGVVVSLVYLALQIRQSTMNQRAAANERHHAFVNEQIRLNLDPVYASLRARVAADDQTLTNADYEQFIALQVHWFVGMDQLLWLRDNKLLDPANFAPHNFALRADLARPEVRATWEAWKVLATPGLRKLVEQHLAGPPPPPDLRQSLVEQWKHAFAAAKHAAPEVSPT